MTSCPVDDADEDARLVDVIAGQVALALICYIGDCGVVAQLQGPGTGREIVFDPEAGESERIGESRPAVERTGEEVSGGKNAQCCLGLEPCAGPVAAVDGDSRAESVGLFVIAADPELRAAFVGKGTVPSLPSRSSTTARCSSLSVVPR